MRQDARGLTLIELVVAIAVMGVLLGVGVPSFKNLQRRMRADTTFHVLTASLAFARTTAVKSHSYVSVCPSSDGHRCRNDAVWQDGWIVFSDPHREDHPRSAAEILDRVGAIGDELTLQSTAGRTRVRFTADGWAYGSNLSIRLCSPEKSRMLGQVIVNNAGRPRTERYASLKSCPHAP